MGSSPSAGGLLDPRFWRLLLAVRRFQRLALAHLAEHVDSEETYGEFLARHGFSADFVNHYAVPVVSCVWSSGHDDALRYPAGYLFAFLGNHGFLRLRDAPQWYVVEGGSSSYVDKILETLDEVVTATPVTAGDAARREASHSPGTWATLAPSTRSCSPHTPTRRSTMLADATVDEKEVLGAFSYSRNDAVLHRDESLLPTDRAARGGWNYRMPACAARGERVQVSYWMNRLQHHDERSPLVVTLNPGPGEPPESVLAEMSYTHPVYTQAARRAQRRLPSSTPIRWSSPAPTTGGVSTRTAAARAPPRHVGSVPSGEYDGVHPGLGAGLGAGTRRARAAGSLPSRLQLRRAPVAH